MLFYIVFIVAATAAIIYFGYAIKTTSHVKTLLKILTLILAAAYFFELFNNDFFLMHTFKLENVYNSTSSLLIFSMKWLRFAALLATFVVSFFSIKTLQRIAVFFVLPVAVLNVIFFQVNITSMLGQLPLNLWNYRIYTFAIQLSMLLAIPTIMLVKRLYSLRFKDKAEVISFVFTLVSLLLLMFSVYGPRVLFGASLRIPNDLNFLHRSLIYFTFIIPLSLYLLFKKQPLPIRHVVCLLIALAAFIHFFEERSFHDFQSVTYLPLHLCHTAMIIMPICLIWKVEKVFYFTYFINVLGALIAILMPNVTVEILNPDMISFWWVHLTACFLPLLIVALGVYPRPNFKRFRYSIAAFFVYFTVILFVNAWFINFGSVDYFFLNSDYIVDQLPFGKGIRNFTFTFYIKSLPFKIYPVYQATIFAGFVALTIAQWFVYEAFFDAFGFLNSVARKKEVKRQDMLQLFADLKGRVATEPVSLEGVNMISIRHFSKTYGSSKIKAVDDFSLQIEAGEVFGFLGHNGAGKSTLIKCMVGIQPLTEGKIEICGYDIMRQPIEAKSQIGYVPDHYALYEKLTGREYVNYVADLYRVTKQDREERIAKYIKMFALEQAFDQQMKSYSHGMKQKIAVIAALVHNPKVWILDEPLTGLDPTSLFQIKECMKEHAKQGNIVFFSSHIIDVVEKVATKVCIIKKGKLQIIKSLDELAREKTSLEQLYLSFVAIEGKSHEK